MKKLTEMTYAALATHEQHLMFRADAPGVPGAGHSHSRRLREVRAEMSRRPCCSLARAGHADTCPQRAAYLRDYAAAAGQ